MPRELLKRWLSRRPRVTVQTACLPAGTRVYAIGDIHGRLDLLTALHEAILEDHAGRPAVETASLIYLGDYVDRGPDSRGVIDLLVSDPLPTFGVVHLMGNHDEAMLRFLDDPSIGPTWSSFGGDATLLSYGVRATPGLIGMKRHADMRRQLVERIPASHVDFLRDLQMLCEAGDYAFVHAGVKPGVPLGAQRAADALWIRDEFLSSPVDHGRVIVHGHTPTAAPVVRANRIGIDTGAFASGVLTCLGLEDDQRWFLATAAAERTRAAAR